MKLKINILTVKLYIYYKSNCEVTIIYRSNPENPFQSKAQHPKSE